MQPSDPEDVDEVDTALAGARGEFVDAFDARCDRMATLIDDLAGADSGAACAELAHLLHRMGGLGGVIGLPLVSDRAREFEDLVRDAPAGRVDVEAARRLLTALRAAFQSDLSR